MASQQLTKALDRVDMFLHQQRGSIGSPRAVQFLNRLMAIQRFVQENGREVKKFPQLNIHLRKIEELLGFEDK